MIRSFRALVDELPAAPGLRGAVFQTRRGREVHLELAPADVLPLSAWLRTRFEAELIAMIGDDRRVDRGRFEVHYLFARPGDHWFVHATVGVPPSQPDIVSLASFRYPASRFEREIADLFGIRATGHPDPRPLVRHAFWPEDYFPLRKDAGTRDFRDDGRAFPFAEVSGEGVYEIPVGPVHAGVIEPGHFRFSVMGETIIKMKSRLYFTHKGTEKLFEGREPAAGVELAERISGDTTVGHSLAYCQALEAGAGADVPPRARLLRVVLLELERLYNHVNDFGAIANDTGFAIAQAHGLRIRERLLRLNKRLTGSRLLRGCLAPGGLTRDLAPDAGVADEVDAALADFNEVVGVCFANTLLTDRLEGTGRLTARVAEDHGALGYVARASGLDIDARRDYPFAAYPDLDWRIPVRHSGDVLARAQVRVDEAQEAARLIRQAIERLSSGAVSTALPPLAPYEPAFSLVEGWRGTILHWVSVDPEGRLHRVKVVDPSFLNWRPLSLALLTNIVPDFPLCNKSFNQSYSGHDL
ncbi:MAG TPA: NADH-quinone oxidoreductase subunit C [Vicinamibacterales bacterium]|nr:NADH-quinone oxidoreductase subunit C [Vicinamibacterales bacterium]